MVPGSRITGLAYDIDTDRLIATGGNLTHQMEPIGPGYIYLLDPRTGQVTVLNDDAPNMFGIAKINPLGLPEPSTLALVAFGVIVGGVFRRRLADPIQSDRTLGRLAIGKKVGKLPYK